MDMVVRGELSQCEVWVKIAKWNRYQNSIGCARLVCNMIWDAKKENGGLVQSKL